MTTVGHHRFCKCSCSVF